MTDTPSIIADRVRNLSFWQNEVTPEPLTGGITNANFLVRDGERTCFVRAGDDIPLHGVMRFNELAASRAAYAAGISPRVLHFEPGILVLEFIEGKTFGELDVRDDANLERILPLVKRCHHEVPNHLRGPVLMFWVFQVIRDYAATLVEGESRLTGRVPEFLALSQRLETAVGQVDIVFGHNDLLPANFIDDGERLWLIDYDYAGFNSPLFDLGGLASNNGLSESQESWLLENYFERPIGERDWTAYRAMKCASLLRETMWSLVSEIHSSLDFDYVAYSEENLARFEAAMKDLGQ